MRKIKFRAWDKKCIEKGLEMYSWKEMNEVRMDDFWNNPRFHLMQYTGLHDKHGNEIYEGDVVKLFDFNYEVVFECGAFLLATKKTIEWDKLSNKIAEYTGCDNNPYFCMNDNVVSLWEIYWNFNEEGDYINCCEVIGNIYENPELLEDKNE